MWLCELIRHVVDAEEKRTTGNTAMKCRAGRLEGALPQSRRTSPLRRFVRLTGLAELRELAAPTVLQHDSTIANFLLRATRAGSG